jgi:hypothetical protein
MKKYQEMNHHHLFQITDSKVIQIILILLCKVFETIQFTMTLYRKVYESRQLNIE